MRRMLWAGLLALPVMLATAEPVQAQGCSSCPGGGGGGGPVYGWFGSPTRGPFGCNGFCLGLFGTWLQDGPLVNYGPYEGYYPFEPYGPWTSDLRYTGPTTRRLAEPPPSGGIFDGGVFDGRAAGRLRGALQQRPALGQYALATFRNVIRRVQPCSSGDCGASSGCSSPGGCGG